MIRGSVFMPVLFEPLHMLPLSLVYNFVGLLIVAVIADIILSFVYVLGGRVPYNRFTELIKKTSDAITAPLKRYIRPVRMGAAMLDLSPMIAIIVLSLLQSALLALIRSLS